VEVKMDKTDLRINVEKLGTIEAAILSSHMHFFQRNFEDYDNLKDEEIILYETVIRYFSGHS
jgi:hypothetical protein